MRFGAAVIAMGGALVVALALAGQDRLSAQENSSAAAQPENTNPLGVVKSGNATIVFAPADSRDIDSASLRTWGEFADAHPRIAHALAYKPSLMNDAGYLRRNPDLGEFFRAHPDIKQAMTENPGNFDAIPPRPGE
jgi:hypothetical protein